MLLGLSDLSVASEVPGFQRYSELSNAIYLTGHGKSCHRGGTIHFPSEYQIA